MKKMLYSRAAYRMAALMVAIAALGAPKKWM